MANANPWVNQLLQESSLYSKAARRYLSSTPAHIPTSGSPKADLSPCGTSDRFFTVARTSIFGERKAFDSRQACRETLRLATSLLTQYDYFPEKLTFIQNSLLLLYIDKKMKNWKTVTLYFLVFYWQSLFLSQPGRKHQTSTSRSCLCCWSPFVSIMPGKYFYFFDFLIFDFIFPD